MDVEIDQTVDIIKKKQDATERQTSIENDLKIINKEFFCDSCNKQYKNVAEMSNHLSSYDHHHKKVLEVQEPHTSNVVTRYCCFSGSWVIFADALDHLSYTLSLSLNCIIYLHSLSSFLKSCILFVSIYYTFSYYLFFITSLPIPHRSQRFKEMKDVDKKRKRGFAIGESDEVRQEEIRKKEEKRQTKDMENRIKKVTPTDVFKCNKIWQLYSNHCLWFLCHLCISLSFISWSVLACLLSRLICKSMH